VETVTAPVLDWSAAARSLDGEESGDRHLVKPLAQRTLLAVADGLGHGHEAALAAKTAMAVLEAHADLPVDALLRLCHDLLRPTRGATLSLASFSAIDDTMTWLGVGSVDGVLLRAGASPGTSAQRLLSRSGVVGHHLPALGPVVVRIAPGDTLIMVTDGIHDSFAETLGRSDETAATAQRILGAHATGHDDALVLVARYLGGGR